MNFEKSLFLVEQMVVVAVQDEEHENFHKKVLFVFVSFICPCYNLLSKSLKFNSHPLHFFLTFSEVLPFVF